MCQCRVTSRRHLLLLPFNQRQRHRLGQVLGVGLSRYSGGGQCDEDPDHFTATANEGFGWGLHACLWLVIRVKLRCTRVCTWYKYLPLTFHDHGQWSTRVNDGGGGGGGANWWWLRFDIGQPVWGGVRPCPCPRSRSNGNRGECWWSRLDKDRSACSSENNTWRRRTGKVYLRCAHDRDVASSSSTWPLMTRHDDKWRQPRSNRNQTINI